MSSVVVDLEGCGEPRTVLLMEESQQAEAELLGGEGRQTHSPCCLPPPAGAECPTGAEVFGEACEVLCVIEQGPGKPVEDVLGVDAAMSAVVVPVREEEADRPIQEEEVAHDAGDVR